MLYRIQKPDVKKIALVATGANGNTWHLLKQAPQPGEIIKASGDDWRIAYIVVAEPGKVEGGGIQADGSVAKGEDGQPIQDVWDEASIREAAHSFARNGGLTVDAHFTDGQTLGRWAESYIAPVDHQIEGRPIKAGSWVLGIEPSSEGRRAIVDGRIGGVSVEGSSLREPVLKAEADEDDELLEDVAVALVTAALAKSSHVPGTPYHYRHGWHPITPGPLPHHKRIAGSTTHPTRPTYRERRLARVDRLRDWADKREARARADYERGRQQVDQIPLGEPIHSRQDASRRKRAFVPIERSFADRAKAEQMRSRAANIEAQAAHAIYSDDPNAPQALKAKVTELEAKRDRIKAYNASARKAAQRGEKVGDTSLLTPAERADLVTHIRTGFIGPGAAFPGFVLSNLNGTINRTKKRLRGA